MSPEKNCSAIAILRSRQGVPTLLVVVAGLAASLAVFFAAYFWELRSVRENFDSLAEDRFQAVESLFDESGKLIGFMDNVFLIAPKATSPEFTGYLRSLKAFLGSDLSKHLSVHGITWAPRVPNAERAAYERAAQAVIDPNYRIHEPQVAADKDEAKNRADSYPVYLSIGNTLLRRNLGEDISLRPDEWKAMQAACDTGEAAATVPIKMSADANAALGYRVFQPLYAAGELRTVEQRRQACMGFMCLDLDIGVMIGNALENVQLAGIEFLVHDGAGAGRITVCRHASRLAAAATSAGKNGPEEIESTSPAKFFGRELSLECRPSAAFWAKRTIWQPWVLLCGGLVLTLVMAGHQFGNATRDNEIEQVISTRLAALQKEVAQQQAARFK
jgi:CHASE1-domain containing sensor protein